MLKRLGNPKKTRKTARKKLPDNKLTLTGSPTSPLVVEEARQRLFIAGVRPVEEVRLSISMAGVRPESKIKGVRTFLNTGSRNVS